MGTLSSYNLEGEEIETISRITCRIETKEEKGTGIFVQPENSEFVYFITAKHCLLGKKFSKSPDKENTKISIPVPPGKISALADTKNLAQPMDGELFLRLINELESHRLPSLAKKVAARFRISRSCRRTSFSLRSRASSLAVIACAVRTSRNL